MLQARFRLRRAADLARVRQQGRRWRHPLAVLLVCPRPLPAGASAVDDQRGVTACSRFAFSASRRVGNAVRRNRAKRLLREAVRTHLHALEPGWDCLLIAREQTPDAAFADVESAVCELLSRANLFAAAEAPDCGA